MFINSNYIYVRNLRPDSAEAEELIRLLIQHWE